MSDPVAKALALWGMEGADVRFVAGRENRVYRVEAAQGCFALRFRRPGLRTKAELQSELDWLDALDIAGLSVPRPVPSRTGRVLETIGGTHVDLVVWLGGTPMGRTGEPLELCDPQPVFRRLGVDMARLHDASDAWHRPKEFVRVAWDIEGLLGDAPLWGGFWDNPCLSAQQGATLTAFRTRARTDLMLWHDSLDYGLIHADLVRENVLLEGSSLHMIDFDDGGFGFRAFDLATALIKNMAEPAYPALRAALLEGYRSLRPMDDAVLDLFLALRAATYVGWIVPRMSEPGARERCTRFVRKADQLCSAYLDTRTPAV